MIKHRYLLILGAVFIFTMPLSAVVFGGQSFLTQRSQGDNSARTFAGEPWRSVLDARDIESGEYIPWNLLATLEYTQSFRSSKIAQYFFGSNTPVFSGSRLGASSAPFTPMRGPDDILADYFGLPSDFKSTVQFCPRVRNVIVDLFAQFNFDHWVEGLYASVQLPIVATRWNMNLTETINASGSNFHPAGYMANSKLTVDQLTKNVTTFFQGATTFGDMREPLAYGLICGEQKRTAVAELRGILGYNIINKNDGQLGIEFHLAAPTGNRSEALFLFEPTVGNGRHWEVGGALTGGMHAWEDKHGDCYLAIEGHLAVVHLCKSWQKRSFDFTANGPGSRYMLLQELGAPVNNLNVPTGTPAINQYQSRLFTAINKTTLNTQISIPAQIDFVIKAVYRGGGLGAEIGYNLWFRTAEKLTCRQQFEEGKYAMKGDAMVYGFDELFDGATAPITIPVALNASQSKATLHAGQGTSNFVAPHAFENLNVDASTDAFDKLNNVLSALLVDDFNALPVGLASSGAAANSSNPPILLKDSDLNNCSALSPKGISHKLFANIGYAWETCKIVPYVGFGAEVELSCICFTTNSALSQWGFWFKGGISY